MTSFKILQLIAAGWTIIESDGSCMTIQAPEDWDEPGDREIIVDTTMRDMSKYKVFKTPLEMIAEWRKGCTCSKAEHPEECTACTVGLIDAMEKLLQEPKVGDGTPDAALAIGKHAFRAGYHACYAHLFPHLAGDGPPTSVNLAWSDYDPPEDIKRLA